jgi:hypothetical protein
MLEMKIEKIARVGMVEPFREALPNNESQLESHDKPANVWQASQREQTSLKTTCLLFLDSQNEGLFALALFQKVMINRNLMPMGVNFQKGVFALASFSRVGRFIMGLYLTSHK